MTVLESLICVQPLRRPVISVLSPSCMVVRTGASALGSRRMRGAGVDIETLAEIVVAHIGLVRSGQLDGHPAFAGR